MPDFAYEALTAAGTVTQGAMVAASEDELEQKLREAGEYLIRAEPIAQQQVAVQQVVRKRTDIAVPRKDLLAFTEFLAGATHAGLPILTILDDVQVHIQSKPLRLVIAELRESVAEEGRSLSEAMAEHPKTFSKLFLGAVQAGEATGQLDYVLGQLVAFLDWQENIVSQVRQATLYPMIVLGVILVLITVLIVVVYPRLLPLLQSFDVTLPLPTRFLLTTSLFMRDNWIQILSGLVAAFIALKLYLRTDKGAWQRDRLLLNLPVFGKFIWEVNMARFVTYMALFYRAGVELIHGLTIVEQMLPNRVLADAVRSAREDITAGSSISAAFARTGRFPIIVLRAVALGEATGSLDDSLARAKAYYDRELPAAVRRLLTGIQPMLVITLGIVVTIVALSIFLPMMSVYRSTGQ